MKKIIICGNNVKIRGQEVELTVEQERHRSEVITRIFIGDMLFLEEVSGLDAWMGNFTKNDARQAAKEYALTYALNVLLDNVEKSNSNVYRLY